MCFLYEQCWYVARIRCCPDMYHIRPHLTRHENHLYFLFPCTGNSSLNFKHSISRHLGVGSSAVSDVILGWGGSYVDIADVKCSEFAQVARHRKKHPKSLRLANAIFSKYTATISKHVTVV